MQRFRLQSTEIFVSALCYGPAHFGASVRGEAVDRLFGLYRDAGGNCFDTAHCYCFWIEDGLGASERELGACIRRHQARDEVILATKGGHPAVEPGYPRPDAYLSSEVIAADIDESLARLGFDVIDLYFLHRDDARVSVGEIIETLNAEIKRGRIRALGASNWRSERIAEANAYAAAHDLHGFVVSQPQWSLAEYNITPTDDPCMRALTPTDIAWHTANHLPVMPYSPTACGYFAGRDNDLFANKTNHVRRERVRALAAELGCTPNQLALAYLLQQPFPVMPIIGTSNEEHLRDALGATRMALTREQMQWLMAWEY